MISCHSRESGNPETMDPRLPRKNWGRPFLFQGKHAGMTKGFIFHVSILHSSLSDYHVPRPSLIDLPYS
ncbi:MAG: hypothetical protein A3J12_08975 [Omnitrophica bacterium RIFCSPLOWO2_02_FULL_44_11]|nr:MAG: hypothetical protein A3B72_00185 [Omnitrophica bacterium RIFCSPHIGHO2_02_FULL_45_28]OGX05081.1 MAG: hypothetical protein A3J12_08975 [Omnitrophica bacterium RIFCSPLOWO2_02_FULL_44_11]